MKRIIIPELMRYGWYMKRGTRCMNLRLYGLALKNFEAATELNVLSDERARALQMQGIVLRLQRNFGLAEHRFEQALEEAGRMFLPGLCGRILRDLGMSYVDRARLADNSFAKHEWLGKADAAFSESVDLLTRADEILETAVTSGFIGRAELLRGRRTFARSRFIDADDSLRAGPNRDYELNNLMVMLLAVYDDERAEVRKRIWQLIRRTGQYRRLLQLPMIEGKLLLDRIMGGG